MLRDLVFCFFTISVLSILLPVETISQVIIKEKVEINPSEYVITPENPVSTHTIRIELQWTPGDIPAAILGYSLPCQSAGGIGFDTGGNLTYLIENVLAGVHLLQFRFNIPCTNPQTVNGQYQVYFNNELVRDASFTVGGCFNGTAYPHYNTSYEPPLVSDYNLRMTTSNLCYGEDVGVWVDPYNSCETGTAWNMETEVFTFSIISGGEYASFYDSNDQLLGETVTGTWGNLDAVIKLDSTYTGSDVGYVLLSSQWGGVEKNDSLKIYPVNNVTIIPDIEIGDTLNPGDETDIYLSPGAGSECIYYVNKDMTYQMEIIYGQQFGNMINLMTGEKVKEITGYFSYYGYTRFIYEVDGITPNSIDSVIIRISASEPEIPFTDLTLYIKPPPIYVYTIPDVVGADDTADVIIKKRNPDGTLEDFPAGQTFELTVIDGCVNGNILIGDSVGVYFADALQPVKFVTADSLESDSGYVRLRVGTDVSGFMRPIGSIKGEEEKHLTEKRKDLVGDSGYSRAELRAGFERMMEERETERLGEKNKTGEDPPIEAPIIAACYNGSYINEIGYWEGDVRYEKGGCDNLSDCIGVPYPEFVQYKMVPSGLINNNPVICEPNIVDPQTGLLKIQTGGFISLDWRFERSQRISTDPCFNSGSNEVRFNMILSDVETNQNSLILKPEAMLEVCEDNISNGGLILINNTDQLLNIIRQFPEQIPIIKADMDSSLSRYGASVIKYKFRQEIVAHETEHKKDYEYYLDSLKTDWLDGGIMDYALTCSHFNSDPYAIELANVEYLSLVKEYVNESNTVANERTNEITLHQRLSVQTSLGEYYMVLFNFENGLIF